MDNQSFGFEIGLSKVVIILILLGSFFVLVFMTDYYQVMNLKEGADNIVKRVITMEMEKKIEDERSRQRIISFDINDLKTNVQNQVEALSQSKLKSHFTLTNLKIEETDKFYFYYEGIIQYKPLLLNTKLLKDDIIFDIPIHGRSKFQRFDWEDRADGSVITQ